MGRLRPPRIRLARVRGSRRPPISAMCARLSRRAGASEGSWPRSASTRSARRRRSRRPTRFSGRRWAGRTRDVAGASRSGGSRAPPYDRGREGAARQLLLPARRRRRRAAAAQARAVPPRDGDRDARPRARRPALAAPRRGPPDAVAGVGAPRALRRRVRRQAGRGARRDAGARARADAARLQLRRLVIPDENATWALTAIPAGIRLVREHGIDVVVSTSPPGSTHLIAAAIARATGITLGGRPARLARLPRPPQSGHDGDEGEGGAARAGRAPRRVAGGRHHVRLRGDQRGDDGARPRADRW